MKETALNFVKKHGWSLLGLLFAGGTYLVENKKASMETQSLKDEIKKEVLKELQKGE